MKATLFGSTFAAALVATIVPSFGQTAAAPKLLNVVHYRVKVDHLQEFEEVEKQIAGSYKKAAVADQFRVIYRSAAGNTMDFQIFTPMTSFADRDAENPYNKMATEQERLTRTARLAQYLESVQVTIDRPLPDLGINTAGVQFPPTFFHAIRIRVRSGGAEEFNGVVKNELVPALKKADVKTLLARRTVLGGVADYQFVEGFEKWAVLDNPDSLPKIIGAEAYRKLEDKLNQLVTLREDTVWRYQPELSYYPGAATASSR